MARDPVHWRLVAFTSQPLGPLYAVVMTRKVHNKTIIRRNEGSATVRDRIYLLYCSWCMFYYTCMPVFWAMKKLSWFSLIFIDHWKDLCLCIEIETPARKRAYSNILKISPPKTESFQIKILIFFSYFCSKHRLWVLVRAASPRRL